MKKKSWMILKNLKNSVFADVLVIKSLCNILHLCWGSWHLRGRLPLCVTVKCNSLYLVLLIFSLQKILFSLLWLTIHVKWGHNLCVWVPHQYWCHCAFVPSLQTEALKANVHIHKVEWTKVFGFMDVMYGKYEKLSCCIYATFSLDCFR